jgi:hypothetical protein
LSPFPSTGSSRRRKAPIFETDSPLLARGSVYRAEIEKARNALVAMDKRPSMGSSCTRLADHVSSPIITPVA